VIIQEFGIAQFRTDIEVDIRALQEMSNISVVIHVTAREKEGKKRERDTMK
jgi:hypothetical protein